MLANVSKDSFIDLAWEVLAKVPDPEIPVLTILDLGIVRDVRYLDDTLEVVITPTYSGCPAMDTIETDIIAQLKSADLPRCKVTRVLSPAWTTDWLSAEGREKLRGYGIAPPAESSASKKAILPNTTPIYCPLCGSQDTQIVSEFGSTPCKSHYRCRSCLEPFDYFKCL